MMYCLIYVRRFALLLCLAALCLCTQGDQVRASAPVGMSFATAMPQTVLWAWEEPEDLRATHAESIGIAYLAETLLLDKAQAGSPGAPALAIRSRHQPLAVAPGAAVMAVVRVEPQPDFRDSPELRQQTTRSPSENCFLKGAAATENRVVKTASQSSPYEARSNSRRRASRERPSPL